MTLVDYISKKVGIELHARYSIIILLATIFIVIIIPTDNWLREYGFSKFRFVLYSIILLIIIIIRSRHKFHIKKNKKNRIWIVVAIYAEKSEEEIKLKNDFINKLKEHIWWLPVWNIIDIITIKNHISEKISNDKKKVLWLHNRVKWHFYLHWTIRKRNIDSYYLDLNWLVIHSPLADENIRNILKEDFISSLPQSISFSESVEIEWFNITADSIFITIRYITGIASLLSWDPFYAMEMHKNLKIELDKFKITDWINIQKIEIEKIKKKLPYLISDELLSISMIEFYVNHNPVLAKELLDNALKTNAMNYDALVFQSVFEFLVYQNIDKAIKSTNKAKEFANWNWVRRYNQAFLYFRKKNYQKAVSVCYRIKDTWFPYEDRIVKQVEEFTLGLLQKQPNFYQLYFRLWYLNYHKLDNYPMTLYYFEKFEEKCNIDDILLTNISNAYLKNIKKEMKIL